MRETVWVSTALLTPSEQFEIAAAVERMLQAAVWFVENEQEVFTAMIAGEQGERKKADALIAEPQKKNILHADIRPGRRCGFPASKFP